MIAAMAAGLGPGSTRRPAASGLKGTLNQYACDEKWGGILLGWAFDIRPR